MSKRTGFSIVGLVVVLFSIWIFSSPKGENAHFSEKVKVALRDVGHRLLLNGGDTTSLVLPVTELENFKYVLSFKEELSFEPDVLVSLIKEDFEKAELSNFYLVEVLGCLDGKVVYSYQMKNTTEESIIPCRGRVLPKGCYRIEVRFTDKIPASGTPPYLYALAVLAFLGLQLLFYFRKSPKNTDGFIPNSQSDNDEFSTLGSFQFYPEQNKLVKAAVEISLSKKECELLAIFIARPNETIKRDELSKRVWEDKGVFVGRSLDTYISKLRKILKDDTSIKLTNVHGVGYKLEVVEI